jgi:hypothetical protein
VVDRWLSVTHGLTQSRRRKWLGFSLEETKRWLSHLESQEIWLPLVLGIPMRRADCRNLVMKEMGWPEPPRSNCWMCPNQSDDEWREIRANRPHEFEAAVRMEREVQKRDPHAFFHRSCVPLDQVDWTEPETLFDRQHPQCASGECFV